jgi:hypothetical protein
VNGATVKVKGSSRQKGDASTKGHNGLKSIKEVFERGGVGKA